jgi:hypothetical protein
MSNLPLMRKERVPVLKDEGARSSITREVKPTQTRTPPGKSSLALMIKAILRPPLKIIYYILRWGETHKVLACILLMLLLGGIVGTNYALITNQSSTRVDTITQSLKRNVDLSQNIRQWLIALRSGDIPAMQMLEQTMLRSADTGAYALQFSEPYAHIQWDNISLASMSQGPDHRIDTLLELDVNETLNGTKAEGIYFWHFTTNTLGQILFIDVLPGRHVIKQSQ